MQPADFRSASSWVCPRNTGVVGSWAEAENCGVRVAMKSSRNIAAHGKSKTKRSARCSERNRARNESVERCSNSESSESKFCRTKNRKKRAPGVNVAKSLARLQHGSAAGKNNVLRERRSILHADAKILSDRVANRGLKQDVFERLRTHETQEIEIHESLEFRSDIEVGSSVG